MVALKQGSVPDVIANKLDHLLILTSGTEQYLITCTNKKYKFLLTTTLTISVFQKDHMLRKNHLHSSKLYLYQTNQDINLHFVSFYTHDLYL